MGKYSPLLKYFESQPADRVDLILTFHSIEEIICENLPDSAFHHRAWWSNENHGSHVEAHSWMGAGWMVEDVDFQREVVRFVRKP